MSASWLSHYTTLFPSQAGVKRKLCLYCTLHLQYTLAQDEVYACRRSLIHAYLQRCTVYCMVYHVRQYLIMIFVYNIVVVFVTLHGQVKVNVDVVDGNVRRCNE